MTGLNDVILDGKRLYLHHDTGAACLTDASRQA